MMPAILLHPHVDVGDRAELLTRIFQQCSNCCFEHIRNHPDANSAVRVHYGMGLQLRAGGSSELGYDLEVPDANFDFCKDVFHFGEEIAHVLVRSNKLEHPNAWFEETISLVVALYVLDAIARLPSGSPLDGWSYGQGRPYAEGLMLYRNRFQDMYRLPHGITLPEYIDSLRADLRSNSHHDGAKTIASVLYQSFRDHPRRMNALQFMNVVPCRGGDDSISDYLRNWGLASPESDKDTVSSVCRLVLGADLWGSVQETTL